MALLNYVESLQSLYEKSYSNKLEEWNDNQKLQLIFSGDKHLITHGVDFLADYNGSRGLVPTYSSNTDDYLVLGKEGWISLTNNHLPIDDNALPSTKLWTSQKISDEISKGFAANDAMVFKGVLGKVGETTHSLPTGGYHAGWTYRVVTAGNYADQYCEVGDLVIATVDAVDGQSAINNAHWAVVQTNIDGSSKVTINGIEYDLYTNGAPKNVPNGGLTFVAPEKVGNVGQVLTTGADNKLGWVNQNDINAGTADKVNKSLKLGTGLSFSSGDSYDGSIERIIHLSAASSATKNQNGDYTGTLGGVMVDTTYLTLNSNGVLSIDANKFASALGKLEALTSVLSAEGTTTSAKLVLTTPGASTSTVNIEGAGGINVTYGNNSAGDDSVLISVTQASNDTFGGIKTGFAKNDNERNYPVEVDNFGKAYVNVPWVNENSSYVNSVEAFSTDPLTLSASISSGKLKIVGEIKTAGSDLGVVKSSSTVVPTNNPSFHISPIKDGEVYYQDTTYTLTRTADKNELTFTSIDGNANIINITPIIANNVTYSKCENGKLVAFSSDNGVIESVSITDYVKSGTNVTIFKNTDEEHITISATDTTYSAGTGLSLNGTTFHLNNASTNGIGGIMVGKVHTGNINVNTTSYTEGRYYGVETDNSGKAFVNVPWTDTHIRDIQINGTSIGDDVTLNIVPSADVVISWDTNENGGLVDKLATISFGLSWFNISDNKYETMSIAQ